MSSGEANVPSKQMEEQKHRRNRRLKWIGVAFSLFLLMIIPYLRSMWYLILIERLESQNITIGWTDTAPDWFLGSILDVPDRTFFRQIEFIQCGNDALTDQDLLALGEMVHLSWLDVGSQITDAGLTKLGRLTHLDSLYLDGSQVRNLDSLTHCDLRNLTTLSANSSTITDQGLSRLLKSKKLTSLCLDETEITDRGLKVFAGCVELQYVTLSETKITDEGLQIFNGNRSLVDIDLSGTQIKGKGLSHLKDSAGLTRIDLMETELNDEGLAYLNGFQKLEYLNLFGTKVSDEGLSHLNNLPSLKNLNLRRTRVTVSGLAQLQKLKSLGSIAVSCSKPLEPGDSKALGSLANMSRLQLEIPLVTTALIDGLMAIPQLNRLELPAESPLLTAEFLKEFEANHPGKILATFSADDFYFY